MAKLQIPTYVGTIYCWRKKRTAVKREIDAGALLACKEAPRRSGNQEISMNLLPGTLQIGQMSGAPPSTVLPQTGHT